MKKIIFPRGFYISISYLLYAISMSDKEVNINDKRSIVKSITEDWNANVSGFNSDNLIYETISTLIKENTTSEIAFIEFKKYVINNPSFFSKEINHKLLKASHRIISTNSRNGKSELLILVKIHNLFKSISNNG